MICLPGNIPYLLSSSERISEPALSYKSRIVFCVAALQTKATNCDRAFLMLRLWNDETTLYKNVQRYHHKDQPRRPPWNPFVYIDYTTDHRSRFTDHVSHKKQTWITVVTSFPIYSLITFIFIFQSHSIHHLVTNTITPVKTIF